MVHLQVKTDDMWVSNKFKNNKLIKKFIKIKMRK